MQTNSPCSQKARVIKEWLHHYASECDESIFGQSQATLDVLLMEVSDDPDFTFDQLKQAVNAQFTCELEKVKKFHKEKEKAVIEMKNVCLEESVQSIILDLDRLTELDKSTFDTKYGMLFESAFTQSCLPRSQRQLRLLDID